MSRTASLLTILVLSGMVSFALCPAAPAADAPAKLTPEQAKALVAKLGDKDFKVRETAQKELAAGGPAILPILEEAAKSDDAEVKQRAAEAIKQIRGEIALAVSREVAKNWLWSYPIDNGAMGGPTVCGSAVYVVGRDYKLHAVDAKTGKAIWVVDLPVKGTAQISANDKVVAALVNTTLTAFDVKEGKQLWQKDLKPAAAAGGAGAGGGAVVPLPAPIKGGPAGPLPPVIVNQAPAPQVQFQVVAGGALGQGGGAAAPAIARIAYVRPQAWVVGELVLARVGEKLKAFKAADGADAWEMDVKPGLASCSGVVDGTTLFVSEGEGVTAIDTANQKKLWSSEIANCTRLAGGGGKLLCAAEGKITAIEVKTGKKAWVTEYTDGGAAAGPAGNVMIRGSFLQNLVADDARVYLILGEELITMDLEKGQKSTHKLDLSVPSEDGAAADPAAGGPNAKPMIAIAGNGFVTSSSGGMLRWSVGGGVVYAGNNAALFAFDGKTGQRLWVLSTKQMLSGEPAVTANTIYFGTIRYGRAAVASDEKLEPKDQPGLHAVKLKVALPTSAPAK